MCWSLMSPRHALILLFTTWKTPACVASTGQNVTQPIIVPWEEKGRSHRQDLVATWAGSYGELVAETDDISASQAVDTAESKNQQRKWNSTTTLAALREKNSDWPNVQWHTGCLSNQVAGYGTFFILDFVSVCWTFTISTVEGLNQILHSYILNLSGWQARSRWSSSAAQLRQQPKCSAAHCEVPRRASSLAKWESVFSCVCGSRETESDLSTGKLRDSAKQQNNKNHPFVAPLETLRRSRFSLLSTSGSNLLIISTFGLVKHKAKLLQRETSWKFC